MLPEYSDRLSSILLPQERVLWSGTPRQGFFMSAQDVFMLFFGLVWLAFSLFWTYFASMGGGFFGLFGIPFVCIGIFMVFGRPFYNVYARKNTLYAVTQQRIIICSKVFSSSVDSFAIKTVENIKLTQTPDGRGSIRFGDDKVTSTSKSTQTIAAPAFEYIENPAHVYYIIMQQQKAV